MVLAGSVSSPVIAKGALLKNRLRVIVIGSGLAGLAAAAEIKKSGHEVIVLEARDRIGGRTWTSNKWPDIPLDMGASWIHGVDGNPISRLADEIGASRIVTKYGASITYDPDGMPFDSAKEAEMASLSRALFQALREAQHMEPDRSILEALAPMLKSKAPSAKQAHLLNYILSSNLEHEYSGSLSELSAQWYDSAGEFGGEDALLANGYKAIIDHLSRDTRIDLKQVVKAIHWGSMEICVATHKSEYFADRVIITLPLGVLKNGSVHFAPALPDDMRQAIALLGMGVLNKCYLRFENVFWPADVDWLGYVSPRHGEWTEWVSFKRSANLPILLGFNAAKFGRKMETLTDEQTVASAMKTLQTIFGPDIPQPIDFQITRWASDPYAMGAYSFNAIGSTPAMRRALAKNLNNRLFFAGEASHEKFFGTAHGAYLSGISAAENLLKAHKE